MLFNSYEFIFLFVPLAFFIFFLINTGRFHQHAKTWLVFASLFFYGWWNPIYLVLILSSIGVNYYISHQMIHFNENKKNLISKKGWLLTGLIFNIGLLGYFKYLDFFISNVNIVFGSDFSLFYLALPLAISFFTLQQIAFLMDAHEGLIEKNPL